MCSRGAGCRLTFVWTRSQPPSSLPSFLPPPPPRRRSFSLFFHLFLALPRPSSAGTRALARSPKSGCVFARGARTPRGLRAIYACACDDVGARGEIYKHRTHTSLRREERYFYVPRRAPRESIRGWVSAGTRFLSFSPSWWNLRDLCFADSLRFVSRTWLGQDQGVIGKTSFGE